MIRVATYIETIPEAIAMIQDAYDKGYEVTCNRWPSPVPAG